MQRRSACRVLTALALSPWALSATAQSYPSRPIRIVVPYAPGGAPDILARLLAQELSGSFGSAFTDNKPGAGGTLGADAVAKAAPDGYTLLLTTTATHAINPALYPSMPYDALKDFTPIALVAITPLMLATSPQLQLKNVQDLIAMAKSRPGAVTYASAGVGTMQHIAGELMAQQAGVSMVHVPYKGTSQVVSDLIAGRVTFMLNSTAAFAALVKEDRLRALAVTSPQRLPGWPNVPTLAESGLPGFEASAWYAIYGPAHVPPDVVKAVNREVVRILQLPATRERYATLGLELPADTSADQLGATTRRDLARWGQLIKAKNIKPE